METLLAELARQGLGYLIAVLLVGVIIWQQKRIDSKDKLITDLQDKRIGDSAVYSNNYVSLAKENVATSKDNLNALALLQNSVNTLANSLQNWINERK